MRYVNSPAAAALSYLPVCADVYWVQVIVDRHRDLDDLRCAGHAAIMRCGAAPGN